MYYLRIKKAELVPAKFGNDLKVTMVGLYKLYEGEEKWLKWVKLNEATLAALTNGNILLTDQEAKNIGLL